MDPTPFTTALILWLEARRTEAAIDGKTHPDAKERAGIVANRKWDAVLELAEAGEDLEILDRIRQLTDNVQGRSRARAAA